MTQQVCDWYNGAGSTILTLNEVGVGVTGNGDVIFELSYQIGTIQPEGINLAFCGEGGGKGYCIVTGTAADIRTLITNGLGFSAVQECFFDPSCNLAVVFKLNDSTGETELDSITVIGTTNGCDVRLRRTERVEMYKKLLHGKGESLGRTARFNQEVEPAPSNGAAASGTTDATAWRAASEQAAGEGNNEELAYA